MTIKTRKELVADIKRRVTAGVSKSAIFSRYSMTEWEEAALWVSYPNSDYSDAPLTLRGVEAWRSVSVASDKSELHLGEVRGQSPAAGLISTQSMQSRRVRRGVCGKSAHGDSPHLG